MTRAYMVPWVAPKLPSGIVSIFLQYGSPFNFKKGEVISMENERERSLYYVTDGLLCRSIVDFIWNKSEIMVNLVVPCSVSGGTTYILSRQTPMRIYALNKTNGFSLSFEDMREYLKKNPGFKDAFHNYCALCLKSVIDALTVIASFPAEERIKIFFAATIIASSVSTKDEFTTIPINVTRPVIGKLSYVSMMTIDRIFSCWARKGIIRRAGRNYEICTREVSDPVAWLTSFL